MDVSPSGTTFGDHKKDEYCKRLKRNLKLAYVRQMEQIGRKVCDEKGFCTSPTWPSISSINADGIDTSCGSPFLQVSRVESEVVSSSNNLHKKILLLKSHDDRKPMATSSVKRFPINNFDKDQVIMPPPAIPNLKFQTKKQSNIDSRHNTHDEQSKKAETGDEGNSSKQLSSASSVVYQESSGNNLKSDARDVDRTKVFYRWRVLLNDKHQLIIKGTLECGKVARSKPILQKISSTEVLSIYKHTYILNGNITDDRYELPDYVRGKFNNGFPDDWENVYQIWRNYIAEGYKDSFRWPTPITDDDDDLISEVTDYVDFNTKKTLCKKQVYTSKSMTNSQSTSGYCSRISMESINNQQMELSKKVIQTTADVEKQTNKKDETEDIIENKNTSDCYVENNVENNSKESQNTSIKSSNSNLRSISFLSQIIQKDKVHIILSNMSDENCPLEYFDKFVNLIDSLRYLLSYQPSSNKQIIKKQESTPSENEVQVYKNCNNTISLSETQETNPEEQSNNNNQNKNKCLEYPRNSDQAVNSSKQSKILKSTNHTASESSDSDTYMGIPNMFLDGLIKANAIRFRRDRNRKNRSNDRKNVSKGDQIKEQVEPNYKFQQHNDSSISITEDEYERKHQVVQERNQNLRNNVQQGNVGNEKSKQKPIVKNCEPVHFDIKLNYPSKNKISVNLKESSNRNHNCGNSDGIGTDCNEEKLGEELLKHPFLSHYSEDFQNEEKENFREPFPSKNSNSNNRNDRENDAVDKKKENYRNPETDPNKFRKKKDLSNDTKENTALFGSKENPKKLTSWAPVVCIDGLKNKYILKFEGILLNEAEHIHHKKFITDPIVYRHSANLVESIRNEFFQLEGELNNKKHGVPKELIKQCRSGCPLKIEEFCKEWIELKSEKTGSNKSVNIKDSPILLETQTSSSKSGKRRKENEIVSKCINMQESSSKSKTEKLRTPSISSERQIQKTNIKGTVTKSNKDSMKSIQSESSLSSPEPKKRVPKKRLAQQLQCASSSTSDDDEKQSQIYFKKPSVLSRGNLGSSHSKPTVQQPTVGPGTHAETDYSSKLRKRKKIEDKRNKRDVLASTKRQSDVIVSYERNQQYQDILSDDVASLVTQ